MLVDGTFTGQTDEQLVALALENEAALAVLLGRYEGRLLRYLRHLMNVSRETAEDLLQEVFIKVYRNLNDFDANLKFSNWIYAITRYEALSHYRKHKNLARELSLDDEVDNHGLEIMASESDLAGQLAERERAAQIRGLLTLLPTKYREVLVLKYLEEKDYEEMSAILKKPSGTIATLLNRGRKLLKAEALKKNLTP